MESNKQTYRNYEAQIKQENEKENIEQKYNKVLANQLMQELPKQFSTPGLALQTNIEGDYSTDGIYSNGNVLTIKATPPLNSEYAKAIKGLSKEEIQKAFDDLMQTLNSYSLIDLFNAIMNKALETGFTNKWITLPLTEYIKFIGKEPNNNQKKIARRDITQNLQILERLNLKFKKSKKQFLYFDILLVKGFVNDEISIVFDDQFYFAMKEAYDKKYFTYIPKTLNGINNKTFKHVKLLTQYLSINRRINLTKGTRETNYKVQALYDYVVTLPRVETTNGHAKQQIIEPFEKNLDEMKKQGYFKNWKYDGEFMKKRKSKYTFNDWILASIIIEFSDELNLLDQSIKDNKAKFRAKQDIATQRALEKEIIKQLQDDKDKENKVQKYIAKQVTKGIEQVEQKIRDDLDLLDDEFINQ